MIYHWIENKKKKINESWFCDICNDGLDYGIRGKVNHILSKSEKHDKIMEDFVYEKMGRPKITLISDGKIDDSFDFFKSMTRDHVSGKIRKSSIFDLIKKITFKNGEEITF